MFSAKTKALAVVVGIALGFSCAVWAGRKAEGYSKPSNFVRFHYKLAPETWFYPPFAMLEHMALAQAKPGKTVVIIAGNSILNGFGQVATDVWHRHLQDRLGENYAVLNLSFRGTLPCEGATLVAESLLRQGVRLILISNTAPSVVGRSAGGAYGHYYWHGFYRQSLLPHPAREKDIAAWEATLPPSERLKQNEIRFNARLDARFHFQSLWHHIGYRHCFTLWSPHTLGQSWRSRDQFADDLPGPAPLEARFLDFPAQEMEIVRSFSIGLAEPDPENEWRATAISQEVTSGLIESMFPPAIRPRLLMLQSQNAPYYRDQLTPSERRRDSVIFKAYEALWQRYGIACVTVGDDFVNADFRDRTHLTVSGGIKLADVVAQKIRALDRP